MPNVLMPTICARFRVLDGARDDLGRAGRAAVDEHDERQVGGDAAGRDRMGRLVAVRGALDEDVPLLRNWLATASASLT